MINEIPYDKNGNPLEPEKLKREDCAACRDDVPFKWDDTQKKYIHLDLFATDDYGVMYDCPVQEEESHDD